jgi:hypothetical protein
VIDRAYLSELLPILKANGVANIKMAGLELSFHVEHKDVAIGAAPGPHPDSTDKIAETIRKQEEALPPDLRADSLMDEDKVLNWSSPDAGQGELPLTGDQPL